MSGDLTVRITVTNADGQEVLVSELTEDLSQDEYEILCAVARELAHEDKELADLGIDGLIENTQEFYEAIARAAFMARRALSIQPARAAKGMN